MNTTSADLRSLSNVELINQLATIVKRERAITLALLRRLNEVERRKIHLERYSSIFAYCIDCLGYSRSAACRRIQAARCLQQFPEVEKMLLDGRLNLTTLGLVARVISPSNAAELLGRVSGRRQEEVERTVASLGAPTQQRDRIRPVRAANRNTLPETPDPDETPASATGSSPFGSGVSAPAGEMTCASPAVDPVGGHDGNAAGPSARSGPACFVTGDTTPSTTLHATADTRAVTDASAGVSDKAASRATAGFGEHDAAADANATSCAASNPLDSSPQVRPAAVANQAKDSASTSSARDSFRIEFTASESFVAKFERVRSLVSRSRPGVSLAAIFEASMDAYLHAHDPAARETRRQAKRNKRAKSTQAATSVSATVAGAEHAATPDGFAQSDATPAAPLPRTDIEQARTYAIGDTMDGAPSNEAITSVPLPETNVEHAGTHATGCTMDPAPFVTERSAALATDHKARTAGSKHIPAALRDQVWIRDGGRCTHVGVDGRCPATHGLHIDHIRPREMGGRTTLSNLRLACGQHNQFYADRSYGEAFMWQNGRTTPAPGVTPV